MSYETIDQLYEDIQQTSPHLSINITNSDTVWPLKFNLVFLTH